MFPLRKRKLIRGAVGHVRAGLGIGADYVARYVNLYAPKNGIGTSFQGAQGGNWYRLRLLDGSRIEFAHLSKILKTGKIKEGDKIAITGNTGKITTGPHLHVQIFNKKRLDPEKYAWGEKPVTLPDMEKALKVQVRRLLKEVRKLTKEVFTAQEQRDYQTEALKREIKRHEETLDKLQSCEAEREQIAGEGREAKSLLNRIKNFFS